MAKGKPVGVIKVKVPRHNSQRLGAKLTAEIKHQATDGGVRTDIGHPRHDMNQAIENASEWNSLLLTAKSKRGPQWDVGTQQFHVEEHSEPYYDPTELRDSAKKQYEEENGPEQEPEIPMPRESAFHLSALSHPPPNRHPGHGPHTGGPPPPVNYPYPNSPMRAPPGSGPGMMPPNQFGGRHEPFPPRPPPAMMRGGMPMNMALGGNMGGPVGGMGGPVGGMGGNMGGGVGNMGGGMGNMGGGMGNMGNMGNMGGAMGNMGGNMNTMGGAMGNMDFNPSMGMGGMGGYGMQPMH